MTTQQDVIKNFMATLDTTTAQGENALDAAISAVSNFSSYANFRTQLLNDCKRDNRLGRGRFRQNCRINRPRKRRTYKFHGQFLHDERINRQARSSQFFRQYRCAKFQRPERQRNLSVAIDLHMVACGRTEFNCRKLRRKLRFHFQKFSRHQNALDCPCRRRQRHFGGDLGRSRQRAKIHERFKTARQSLLLRKCFGRKRQAEHR